ncbi:MAG: PAS domain S-box protein [Vicinamibacterales bacterium]
MNGGDGRFRTAFHHAAIGMSLCDLDGRYRDVNPAFCDLLGYSADDLLASNFQNVTHPDDLADNFAYLAELLTGTASTTRFEKRYIKKDGTGLWASVTSSMVRSETGVPLYFVTTVEDITGRRRIEAERTRQQESLQTIFDLTVSLVGATSLDGMYDAALQGLCRALRADRGCIRTLDEGGCMRFRAQRGYSAALVERFATTSRWIPRHENANPVLMEDLAAAPGYPNRELLLAEGIAAFANVPLTTPNGLLGHFVVCYSSPHAFSIDDLQTAQTIAFNLAVVIEREQTVEALRSSEARLAEAQRLAGLGRWEWDLQTGLLNWSAESFKAIGLEPHSTHPTIYTFVNALHPDDRERVMGEISGAMLHGAPFELEFRVLRGAGGPGYVHSRGDFRRNREGALTHVTGIALDVTESRRAELELREAYERLRDVTRRAAAAEERERRRIAREIHDELGQLVTAMRFRLTSLLKRSRLAVPANKAATGFAEDAVLDLVELNEQMLKQVRDLSTSLRPAILDDLGLIPAIQAHAQQFETRTGIGCQVDVEPRLADTRFDDSTSSAVFRVVQELLTNVLRHAEASRVVIRCVREGESLVVRVEDDGAGIDRARPRNRQSFGLRGIEERAALLGGAFAIGPCGGRGTMAELRVPFAIVTLEPARRALRLVAP